MARKLRRDARLYQGFHPDRHIHPFLPVQAVQVMCQLAQLDQLRPAGGDINQSLAV
jgi:hypothetical protein